MRILLDTNVVISAILFGGVPRAILDRAIRGEGDLVTSPVLLDELVAVLEEKFTFPSELVMTIRAEMEAFADIVVPTEEPRVSRDRDDDQVLAAALAGGAETIVTGDRDLLRLGTYARISIMEPSRFIASLEA